MVREKDGFSLVELLVVILIIGILAAIAVPALMGQKDRARTKALEYSAAGVAEEVDAWLHAMSMKLPVVAVDASGNEICYESSSPVSGTCSGAFPGVPVSATQNLDDMADLMDIAVINSRGKQEKSPYNAGVDLLQAGAESALPSTGGVLYISNISDNALRVRGFGDSTSAVLFNKVVTAW